MNVANYLLGEEFEHLFNMQDLDKLTILIDNELPFSTGDMFLRLRELYHLLIDEEDKNYYFKDKREIHRLFEDLLAVVVNNKSFYEPFKYEHEIIQIRNTTFHILLDRVKQVDRNISETDNRVTWNIITEKENTPF